MNNIPKGWALKKIGELGKVITGSTPSTTIPEFYGNDIPFIGPSDLGDCKKVIKSEKMLSKKGFEKSRKLPPNTPMMVCIGSLGKTGITTKDSATNQQINSIICNLDLDPFFILYNLHFNGPKVKSMAGSQVMDMVNKSEFEQIQLLIPPLTEQKKIAEILTSADRVIGLTSMEIEKLKDLKKGMMQELLTKGIGHTKFKDSPVGRIPKSWRIGNLLDVTNKRDRYSFTGGPFGSDLKSEDYTESGVRVIQLQNIGDGEFFNNSKIFTSIQKADELKSCNIYPGDLILSKMSDPLARACIIPKFESRFLMCSDGIRVSLNEDNNVHFLQNQVNHHRFRNEALKRCSGTTRQRIGLTELKSIPIAIPSKEEQDLIAERINSIEHRIIKNKNKLESYKNLKKGLMNDLLTGKVRVKC